MTQIPDLGEPYGSDGERYSAFAQLLSYDFAIEALTNLAELPISQWSDDQIRTFPGSVPGGAAEHPQQRLKRWYTLFQQEIKTIHDVRNRLVHPGLVTVTDAELRGATWLAKQVLSTATGLMPSDMNEALMIRLVSLAPRAN